MASKQHYSVALKAHGLRHSVTLTAKGHEEAQNAARVDAAETSGGEPEAWKIVSCDRVPAPMGRAA